MRIVTWRAFRNPAGTMRGFFSVELPSGVVINDCKLLFGLARDGRPGTPFVGLPSAVQTGKDGAPMLDERGKPKYRNYVDFRDRATADRFRDAVIEALRAAQPEAFDGELI